MEHRFPVLAFVLVVMVSCAIPRHHSIPPFKAGLSGSAFFDSVKAMAWKERESLAVNQLLQGSMPQFIRHFKKVKLQAFDSGTGRMLSGLAWVSPDYVSIGNNQNWARIPLTPMAAQALADSFGCFLPTRKLVDEVYRQAHVKLAPVPMFAFRDSSVTMYQHHLIIEGQRKGKKGLIAGIKKDVVISGQLTRSSKPNRVAIYGWHKPDGKPIQPLYTGHVNWYVDYSHGIRLVSKKMKVQGRIMDFEEVMAHPVYRRLLCDEPNCDFLRY